ncbi:hypothetical protein F443_00282 [Phytophthora nicotianae P1569]|uniref:Uncharacterized protein n=1 Tax=Phytophthora nicotianae P1569 TaxID=1317065 RepID=V9G157_PHYNI|nr:hypothetical protein F443_00282 [Phytophthora nicotianae P1569]
MAADGTRRTKHWAFRLANVVLSDNLFMRLIETTARLNCKDLWKELASFYSICAANFRLSGTHERQFKPFVQGKMALLSDQRPFTVPEVDCSRRTNLIHFRPRLRHESAEVLRPANAVQRKKRSSKNASTKPTPNKKPRTNSYSTDAPVMLVGRIAAAREAEITVATDQYKQAAVRVRSEHYKMLDDLCKRIDKIE